MAIESAAARPNLVDVLDRVLDKGIIIDAWIRTSLVGIDLITIEARCVIASIETYVRFADQLSGLPLVAAPSAFGTHSTTLRSATRQRRSRPPIPPN